MQGRRRHNSVSVFDYEPGDYGFAADGVLWVCLPTGDTGRLEGWTVTEHEDGTVSAEPSILQHARKGSDAEGNTVEYPEWHGYLRHGVFEEC